MFTNLCHVSDSASYCKKAYKDVLSAVYPTSVHMLCLAHIVNLAAEISHHYKDFSHTAYLITVIKSSLFKKPDRKSRLLKYMSEFVSKDDVKITTCPCL